MARIAGTTAAETRARIIAAALELFNERGYAGTTLRDISDRISLTKSSMYHHFASKDDLLDAIIAPLTESIDTLVRDTVAHRKQLEPGDDAGSDALRASVLRALTEIQLDKVTLIRSLLTDPSVTRVLQKDAGLSLFSDEFEHAFSGSDDPGVRIRHRCAIGTIMGALVATAHGQAHQDPTGPPGTLAELVRPYLPVILESAFAVLGLKEDALPGCPGW